MLIMNELNRFLGIARNDGGLLDFLVYQRGGHGGGKTVV